MGLIQLYIFYFFLYFFLFSLNKHEYNVFNKINTVKKNLIYFVERGSCKHVAGICHHIIAKITRGENVSVTSREQAWDLPSGKHQHEPDFLQNINIKEIKGRFQ